MNDTSDTMQPDLIGIGLHRYFHDAEPLGLGGVPDGADGYVLAAALDRLDSLPDGDGNDGALPSVLLHIARDDKRMMQTAQAVRFFNPDARLIEFPAWDCVPYDRAAPNADITAQRISALARLLAAQKRGRPVLVLTTMNALLQKVPGLEWVRKSVLRLKPGMMLAMDKVLRHLEAQGYARAGSVMDRGDYAVRGGIVDFFPPALKQPVRLDFFGDELDTIKSFDPETQRSVKQLKQVVLLPISEVPYGKQSIKRFREQYVALFGPAGANDQLYEAISTGQRYQGMEHWLPLFHDRLVSLFDYVPGAIISFDALSAAARTHRLQQIADHYTARVEELEHKNFGAPPYNPIPPDSLFLDQAALDKVLAKHKTRWFLSDLEEGGASLPDQQFDFAGKPGRQFALERAQGGDQHLVAAANHVMRLAHAGKRVLVAGWSGGAAARLKQLLADHGITAARDVRHFPEMAAGSEPGFAALGLEQGFELAGLAVIAEQDILGERLARPRRKRKKDANIFTEVAALTVRDLVVHTDHGIGRFEGLQTVEALGARHDCLLLSYHGGDKLFLPVENIELLSRYGGDQADVRLDRLGSTAWQARKAQLKKRLLEMAAELIQIAAERELRTAPVLTPDEETWDEFRARFRFEETDDQLASIEAVTEDLASGRPMDRLVCGDVGFGKTEVALRAAYIAAMSGKQVAVVVPTTLLCRQHFATFEARFKGLPLKLAQASRLVPAQKLKKVKEGLADGSIDIVVGTHALLGKTIKFADLGLLIIDEEQHFGVKHKERLKQLRGDVHVLTLTATPIPRTLQMSLSGVRDLSLIATPPVDRLAVRTFVTPFDPLVLREALLRERFRGGQSFYVCPRIADLQDVAEFLSEHVPELRVVKAHGQMAPTRLEEVMTAFYEREFDVLLSTTIVESGLDVPTANTLIVHRADMFGLAQLYQLRGRVGRSKTRAYAYFTTPENKQLTPAATRRLKVLRALDHLGAGFTLASHDLDIRGAGNLLGDEQSGQIREVGIELYQSMLEEAVAALKSGGQIDEVEDQWSPQISLGVSVLLPDSYVGDLQVRLGLYRRLAGLETRQEIDAFAAELTDRFGRLPEEAEYLLAVVEIKNICRRASIELVDAGPKGASVKFRGDEFANPQGLLDFMKKQGRTRAGEPRMKIDRQDHKLVYRSDWEAVDKRIKGVRLLVLRLSELAAERQERH